MQGANSDVDRSPQRAEVRFGGRGHLYRAAGTQYQAAPLQGGDRGARLVDDALWRALGQRG